MDKKIALISTEVLVLIEDTHSQRQGIQGLFCRFMTNLFFIRLVFRQWLKNVCIKIKNKNF